MLACSSESPRGLRSAQRLDEGVKKLMALAAISSRASDTFLVTMLEADRVPARLPTLE